MSIQQCYDNQKMNIEKMCVHVQVSCLGDLQVQSKKPGLDEET